jgi:hypothetical protein
MPNQPKTQAHGLRCTNSRCSRLHRCAVCSVQSFSICGALDQADLLEFERIDSGQFIGDGVVMLSAYRRAASHLCLHDAAILSDTIRENHGKRAESIGDSTIYACHPAVSGQDERQAT